MTYGEIYDYIEALTGLLLDIVQSDEPELSRPAAEAIPRALITCANQTRPAAAVALFRVAVELTVTRKSPISVARLVEALQVVHESFDKREEGAEPEIATEFESCQHEITELIECISTSDFATRLRRWTSEWTREGHEQIGSEGSSRYRFDIEMEDLANESTTEPALLTDDLLSWLCSPSAKRSGAFFWYLGKDDTGKRMLAKIEEIAIQSDGATPFASYIGGLGSHDRPFCADRLSILAQSAE